MSSVEVFFEGRVQGVGFRWTVRHLAKGFDLIGWIKNLPDGRVQMQISGDAEEIKSFLEAINQSELRAHIRKQNESPLAAPVQATGFEIRHD
jgi:acylphosphatase